MRLVESLGLRMKEREKKIKLLEYLSGSSRSVQDCRQQNRGTERLARSLECCYDRRGIASGAQGSES